ncbi:MAG TPA: hypothetical protein VGJ20_20550 [Xanthobacteraceae bacterium]|jgi:hypothetical protein
MTVNVITTLAIDDLWMRVGDIPYWLDVNDPRPAREQLDSHYRHGGGWHPFQGYSLKIEHGRRALLFPGDPPQYPIATMHLRDETILVYPHAIVVVLQPDGSFEACRMD